MNHWIHSLFSFGLVALSHAPAQEPDPRASHPDPWVRGLPEASQLSTGSLEPRFGETSGAGGGDTTANPPEGAATTTAGNQQDPALPAPLPQTEHREAEPNNTIGRAQPVGTTSKITGTIRPLRDSDWYRFDAPRRGALEVRFSQVPPGVAPAFRIYSRDGSSITQWIYPVKDGASETTVVDLGEPGTTYVTVADDRHDSESGSPYELLLTFHPGDGYEPNEALSSASLVSPNRTLRASILPKGDVDRYTVTALRRGSLEVEFTRVPGPILPSIRLYDPDGSAATSWIYPEVEAGRTATHVFDLPRAGRWDLSVADDRHDSRSWEPYELRLAMLPGDQHEPNETLGHAVPIARNAPVTGTILPRGDSDFYALDVPGQDTLTIEITEAPANLELSVRIYDPDMSALTSWVKLERRGKGFAPHQVATKQAGRHYLVLADSGHKDRSSDPYVLVVR